MTWLLSFLLIRIRCTCLVGSPVAAIASHSGEVARPLLVLNNWPPLCPTQMTFELPSATAIALM